MTHPSQALRHRAAAWLVAALACVALSHGAEAQITSPPSARRHYAETVRRTLARYRR